MIVQKPITLAAIPRTRSTARSLPQPMVYLFGLALVLYGMQPWSPSVFGVPLQVMIVWGIVAWLLVNRGRLVQRHRSIFTPLQWLMILVLVGSVIIRGVLSGGDYARFFQVCTGIVVALITSIFFRYRKARTIMFGALACMGIMTSGIALLQSFGRADWSWERTVYFVAAVQVPSGLERTPVALAYSIVGINITLLACLIFGWRHRIRLLALPPGIILITIVFLTGGLVVSQSRSGLLGVALGGMVLALGAEVLRLRFIPRSILIALLVAAFAYAWFVKLPESGTLSDVRFLATWRSYIPTMAQYPFGRSGVSENLDQLEELFIVSRSANLTSINEDIRVVAPHNLILTNGVSFGPAAAIAIAILYLSVLWQGASTILSLRSTDNRALMVWILIGMATNAGVIGHSWFHNASITTGEMRNWFWLGLLMSAVALAKTESLSSSTALASSNSSES